MQRYFFDMIDGDALIADEEGVELSTSDAVLRESALALADMVKDEALGIDPGDAQHARQLAIEVRDQHGPVLRASFVFEIKRLQ
jgi:hypothetical protein